MRYRIYQTLYFALIAVFCRYTTSGQHVERPRGVPLARKSLYEKRSHFQCLDNSRTIPYEWMNDDYCDCDDGSDEPGTSACPNGNFNCINVGHRPTDIPSSRVNDQICDCCDGSDEWMGYVKCPNFCIEAGRAAREQAEKMRAIRREGYEKKQDFIKQGKAMKADNVKKADEQKVQKEALARQLEELDMVKQVAEKSEKEAKDRHIDLWKAESEARNEEKQKVKAMAAFEEIDANKDQKITYDEVASLLHFDKNLDGKVAVEEYLEYFGGKLETERDHFINEIWLKIRHVYRPVVPPGVGDQKPDESGTPSPPVLSAEKPEKEPPSDEKDEKIPGEDFEEEVKEDEVEDFEKDAKKDQPPIPSIAEEPEEKMPDFDENTKKLIADADQARKEYDEVNRKIQSIDSELKRLDEFGQMDFGPDDEFSSIHRQCFETTDSQYTYGLCMFDRTWQKAKDGYSEVSLGRWGSWEGHGDEEKYTTQLYQNGDTCWNGPSRSTKVTLVCGTENKLISASEPARCEYVMEFHTPLVCKEPSAAGSYDEHTEL